MRSWLVLVLLAACSDPPDVAFGFAGVVEDVEGRASTIGLFVVPPGPGYYKLGGGTTVVNQFDLIFPREPPRDALIDGVGVAIVGLLPGVSTVPDGFVDLSSIRLIGSTPDHAVIFKRPGATGPDWIRDFDDGFTCAQCVRVVDGLDTFAPVDCTFVTIEAFGEPCAWF